MQNRSAPPPAGPISPPEPAPAKAWDDNYRLGIWNGWLVAVGDGFLSVTVVLAGFAARLGASNVVIGLLPAIAQGGWMLPQILVAARVRALPYKLPIYRSAALVRTSSYVAMVLVAALLAGRPALCLTLFCLGDGGERAGLRGVRAALSRSLLENRSEQPESGVFRNTQSGGGAAGSGDARF